MKTIEGVYQDGQVQLTTDPPQDVDEQAQVLVTFLTPGLVDSDKVRQMIEQLEVIAGLQQGFDELNSGNTRPVETFASEMKQKYDISG